jgi:hypothetical protein
MNTGFHGSKALVIARKLPGVWVTVAPEEWALFGVEPGRLVHGLREVHPLDSEFKLIAEARPGPHEPLQIRLVDANALTGDPPSWSEPWVPVETPRRSSRKATLSLGRKAKRELRQHEEHRQMQDGKRASKGKRHANARPSRRPMIPGKRQPDSRAPWYAGPRSSGSAYTQAKLPPHEAWHDFVPPWLDPPLAASDRDLELVSSVHLQQDRGHDRQATNHPDSTADRNATEVDGPGC